MARIGSTGAVAGVKLETTSSDTGFIVASVQI